MTKPFRILVVDDDADIVRGVSIRLQASGYDVVSVPDGQAGLASATQSRPDAIVLDIQLPRMDGYSVLQQLAARPEMRDIPVVVLSANVADCAKRRALELGARCFLGKPYNPGQLLGALDAVLDEKSKRIAEEQEHDDQLAAGENDPGRRR